MPRGLLTMSQQEIERISIIEQVISKRLKQSKAGQLLKVSSRQVRRLVRAYRRDGASGLMSKHRGRIGNNRHEDEVKKNALEFVYEHYADFGPTLAAEKLHERHGMWVNKETLRQWMMASGVWEAKRKKQAKLHQSRERRACYGELIQLDGSHHDWFEGRAEPCCLLVLIDDATSQLVGLWFERQETTLGYYHVVRDYIERCGRPLGFYSDKYAVFRVNRPELLSCAQTQFERAMGDLDIELICADSPQAKGRVERANGTLQDRLVKEMRLEGINTIVAANAFLPGFMADYNRRFGVMPRSEINAHRSELPDAKTLDLIFSLQHTRTLSKNLELSYANRVYQVKVDGIGYGLRHAKVTVYEDRAGTVTLLYKGRRLDYQCHKKQKRMADIVDAKQLNITVNQVVKRCIPKPEHPWKKYRFKPAGAVIETRVSNSYHA
jgi:hypothetical protein